ncbi:MAG: hypothetical protein HZB12_01015 [Candidatus Yonathbacteria bacterium]|nr:hypothetical protein [Candidatus Yonathbacteria bacterium]
MNTITIPRNLIKSSDLVIIPRAEYNNLLELKKIIPIINATKKELTVIRRGEKEIKKGQFLTSKQLKDALGL